LILAGCAAWAAIPPAASKVDEQTVHEVASELRCVVCQSLSVADSPSETANQMRGIIRERLAAGDSPEQVRAYFVTKYGNWILLSPPKSGFTLLVWVVPFVALAIGLVLVAVTVRRWSRAPQPAASSPSRPRIASALRSRSLGETPRISHGRTSKTSWWRMSTPPSRMPFAARMGRRW
jgi:cytochrome c-type biogenesis protein CcmH